MTEERPEEGGDPACWLNMICPSCGHLGDGPAQERCPVCGARLSDEA